jgi:hypothetical protein
MRKGSLPEGYKLSRVNLESVIKAALPFEGIDPSSELGRNITARWLQWGGYFVRLPESGQLVWVGRWEDGGVAYKLEGHTAVDGKFIQKLFSIAKRLASSSRQSQESSGEERKKGTSDVSEFVTGTSEDVHGGDSASGEVPDGRSGGGKEIPPNGSSMPSACSASSGGASEYSADASTVPVQHTQGGSDSDSQKSLAADGCRDSDGAGSSGSGTALKPGECAAPTLASVDASQSRAGGCEEGTGGLPVVEILDGTREWSTVPSTSGVEEATPALEREEASVSFKDLRKRMRELAKSSSSTRQNNSFGGVYAILEEVGAPPREFINRGRRVFSRLLSDSSEGEAGPRWDVKKVSARIASLQSFNHAKDKKLERGRPAIAVLPDVSGSMAKFAGQVLEFAKALASLSVPGAEVIVIPHSNGHPLELWVNSKKVDVPVGLAGKDDVQEWYRSVFMRYHVEVVVLAADWDGEWLYRWMSEELNVKIFWCDVWSSSRLAPTVVDFPPKWAGNVEWGKSAVKRVKYAFGCGNVVDFITALEKMVKTKGR